MEHPEHLSKDVRKLEEENEELREENEELRKEIYMTKLFDRLAALGTLIRWAREYASDVMP